MERVLHIPGGTLSRNNGIATFLMNIYRNLDKKKFQFDFIVFTEEQGEYEKEITELGGHIYHVVRPGLNLMKNMYQTYIAMKQHPYHIMHRHTAEAHSWTDFYIAKKAGIIHRIAHSHGTHTFKPILHKAFYWLFIKNITERLACGNAAGKWLYGDNAEFMVIKNGIETPKFKFSDKIRKERRNELTVTEDTLVLGSAGRLANPKNPFMTVRVFAALVEKYPDSRLIMLGEGDLLAQVKKLIGELDIEEKVLLPGVTSEVGSWLCAMDVGIYPSEFEGFPFSVLEAEVNGLPTIISDRISKEVDVLGTLVSMPLEKSPDMWADEILKLYRMNRQLPRDACSQAVLEAGYDIKNTAKDLEQFYERLLQ